MSVALGPFKSYTPMTVAFSCNAPESDVLSIGDMFQFEREWLPEVMGFVPCAACHELTARAYLRVVGEKPVCIPCSGYER